MSVRYEVGIVGQAAGIRPVGQDSVAVGQFGQRPRHNRRFREPLAGAARGTQGRRVAARKICVDILRSVSAAGIETEAPSGQAVDCLVADEARVGIIGQHGPHGSTPGSRSRPPHRQLRSQPCASFTAMRRCGSIEARSSSALNRSE